MLTIARTLMGNPSLCCSTSLRKDCREDRGADGGCDPDHEEGGRQHRRLEQNLHFARLISDRAYIIERGRICFGGTTGELDARPDIRDAHLAL